MYQNHYEQLSNNMEYLFEQIAIREDFASYGSQQIYEMDLDFSPVP